MSLYNYWIKFGSNDNSLRVVDKKSNSPARMRSGLVV